VPGDRYLMKEMSADFSTYLQYLEAGVIVHDPATAVVYCNAKACVYLSLEPRELLGRTSQDPGWVFMREDRSPMPRDEFPVNRIIATGKAVEPSVIGVPALDSGRPELWFVISGFPLFDENRELVHAVTSFIDITSRMQMEESLRASEARYRDLVESIRASLKEKEILLRELHHRVKNNMQVITSLLHLQSRHLKDEHLVELFNESRNRIKSMALVHEKLYRSRDLTRVDMKSYIETLGSHLARAYGNKSVQIVYEVDEVKVDIENSIPLGLIINEIVSNAMKHAFSGGRGGKICISLQTSPRGTRLLKIQDNGAGLPEGLEIQKATTLGMQLIIELVHQLQGQYQVVRDNGTTFIIEF